MVSHLPPGTSNWNKIEHRLFSFISQNWRARPLVSYRVIVELIHAPRGTPTTPRSSPISISTPNSAGCRSASQRASSGKVKNIAGRPSRAGFDDILL
jgi:hypothetical protein